MHGADFARIGEILPRVLEKLGLDRRVAEQRVALVWPQVVGPQAARHSRVLGVREGVLTVEVDQSVWGSELQLQEAEIRRRISEMLPRVRIDRIRFRASGRQVGGRGRP
jgi:predicted nucleic acid-binding Zn ribbon protein